MKPQMFKQKGETEIKIRFKLQSMGLIKLTLNLTKLLAILARTKQSLKI